MERRHFAATTVGVCLTALTGCTQPLQGTTPDTKGQSADRALVITEKIAVEGTNVNIGAEGIAENHASKTLADCVIHVTGTVGTRSYHSVALRDQLGPDEKWEWSVEFGEQADASNTDSVANLTISTQAEYEGTETTSGSQ